jgi:CheY-like chemotaxis protein
VKYQMQHPAKSSDEETLERRTTSFLYSRGLCERGQVVVKAAGSVVILCGELPSPQAKRLCLECCRRVAGVLGVVDQLRIVSPTISGSDNAIPDKAPVASRGPSHTATGLTTTASTASDKAVATKTAEAPARALQVLIADRDEILLETYERFLIRHDIEVFFATNGLECVARLRDVRPGVLVLDPGLLWGGGAGVLARMYGERNLPSVPVIVLGTARDADQLTAALKFPIDAFMAKPVSPEQLLKKIRWVRHSHGPNAHFEGPCPAALGPLSSKGPQDVGPG